jgi:hypothetical protein
VETYFEQKQQHSLPLSVKVHNPGFEGSVSRHDSSCHTFYIDISKDTILKGGGPQYSSKSNPCSEYPESPECAVGPLLGWLTRCDRRSWWSIGTRTGRCDPWLHFNVEPPVHFLDDNPPVVDAFVRVHNERLACSVGSQREFHVRVAEVHLHSVALVPLHRRQVDEVSAVPHFHVQRP